MINDHTYFLEILENSMSHEPTNGQKEAMYGLSRFVTSQKTQCAYLLKGYAGTGKTTLIGALVKALKACNVHTELLAPTGRAAKVMSSFAGVPAYTIHKKIYKRKKKGDGYETELIPSFKSNSVYIVDEVSMIGVQSGIAKGSFSYRNLLEDLFDHVFATTNSRIILVGDGAQLPPVGSNESPAMDLGSLQSAYNLTIAESELTEVVRQEKDSGILNLATTVRQYVLNDFFEGINKNDFAADVKMVKGPELQEIMDKELGAVGVENMITITRSNKLANMYNKEMRNTLLWMEEELNAGDLVMVVKNNYHWTVKDEEIPFIANGDIGEIKHMGNQQELYDKRFAQARIQLVDYPDVEPIEVKILLDALDSNAASLPEDEQKLLYHSISEDYLHLGGRNRIHKAVLEDPYFNALQLKFAYAVTCHKSQGGQWPVVFLDLTYLKVADLDQSYLRWLYTGITRATERLYLINPPDDFFA